MLLLQVGSTAALDGTGFRSLAVPAQVLIAILPLAAVVLLAVLLFFYFLWDYRKKKLSIEKGIELLSKMAPEQLLLLGIVSFFIGLGLLVFFALFSGISSSLLGGIIPMMTGLGILTFYKVRKTKN